jgi:hypothetical protein
MSEDSGVVGLAAMWLLSKVSKLNDEASGLPLGGSNTVSSKIASMPLAAG